MKRPFVQALILILAGSVIAVVANGFAGRTRKLVLPGYYPNALKVPPRAPEQMLPVKTPPSTATVQSPAPGAEPIAVPTTTITGGTTTAAAPVTTTTAPPVTATIPAATTATAAPALVSSPALRPIAANEFQPHPDKASVDISGEDAARLHAAGALFLDARRSSVYEQGHIAGARSFSVWESDIDDKVNALYGERSDPAEQNRPIVIYCSGGACEDSHMLAQKLWGIQFNNIYVYKDGFPDWQKRNGASKTGAQP